MEKEELGWGEAKKDSKKRRKRKEGVMMKLKRNAHLGPSS